MTTRNMRNVILLGLLAGGIPACERADWNWDASWWRTPRPAPRPTTPPRKVSRQSQKEDPTAQTSEARRTDSGLQTADGESRNAGPDADRSNAAPTPTKNRPYYQLYLVSDEARPEVPRGAGHRRLQHVTAQLCAGLLEMLYVPLGRSGSQDECYLIYEQREEFDAAQAIAPLLDVQPGNKASTTKGAEAAMNNGIALMLSIIQESPAANRADIDRCEQFLAEAAQSIELPEHKRWVAAILAGRLLSAYRDDHRAARSYFERAKQQAEVGSIEEMTAEWWRADTFVQEGNMDRAAAIYERLLSDYRHTWPNASIIARSKAILKKQRKR